MSFKEIAPYEFNENPFSTLAKDWALLSAKKDGKSNTMTIAWGFYGVMWGKNVMSVVVRPQRHTLGFIDSADTFSVSFFDDSYKDKLTYCGRTSGKDEDKIAKCGFNEYDESGAPCFEEAKLTIVCRKLYRQQFDENCFIDKDVCQKSYPDKDYHIMYVGEIIKIIKKED